MKMIKLSALMLFLIGLMTQHTFAESGATLLDQGLDGEVRYYTVICPSGDRTSLNYNFKTKETCTQPVKGGTEMCQVNWDKSKAAKEACK
jgi:hypothetical protein